ncbi:MAG: phage integrase SAM-like domain-containing protein, partial [Victivallaceae bacterium]|nr:phage integrase SAM-like domain-containing protein [Victivallaceae bacterium]
MAEKTIKLDIGTVYKKTADGSYYFRYQINGQRKAVSLKTRNQKQAIAKARELLPIVQASTTEIVSAHVQRARSWGSQKRPLPLKDIWEVYSRHPERATPATVSEQNSYESTLREFVDFVGNNQIDVKDINRDIADNFAVHMRTRKIAVDTHNRKIRRLKKIFSVLSEYRDGDNPFDAKSLRRKEREEQEHIVRRTAFTREQEEKILEVLDDDRFKVMNKPEIRVIFYLGMYTGQRLKDVVWLNWGNVSLERQRIW